MSVLTYSFSKRGLMHEERNLPCQDSSATMKYGLWSVAVVADGVGSCKHSDIASELAVKSVLRTINNCFPNNNDENDLISLIRMAMHCAANSVEMQAKKNNDDFSEYQTTLAIALYDGKNLYYGNVGDSGIAALDEYGEYHVLSTKQNNEYGEVIALASRDFEAGKANFNVAAAFCMTDGLLDWVIPKTLKEHTYPVYVPRANVFISPYFWNEKGTAKNFDDSKIQEYKEKILASLSDLVSKLEEHPFDDDLGDLTDGNLRDDLSAAVLINPNSPLISTDIHWEHPKELSIDEQYLQYWYKLKRLYPKTAKTEFRSYITKQNPSWSEDEVDDYATHIWELKNTAKKEDIPENGGDKERITADEQETKKTTKSKRKKGFFENLGELVNGFFPEDSEEKTGVDTKVSDSNSEE